MRDISMFCGENIDCVCEGVCCQECSLKATCNAKCQAVKYAEKVYSSDEFLVEQLYKLAEQKDSWLIAVAADRIKELTRM